MFGGQWGNILLGDQWKVPMFGGPWNVPCLVVNGETSCLVTNGRFQCLVALGRFQAWWPLKGEGKTSFHFFPLPPQQILFKQIFIDFKVLLYHGSRSLLYIFLSFSLTYKLQSHILMYQVFHTFIAKLILIKDFFLSLNSWCRTCPRLTDLKPHK
jgi:hypothetical protein